MVLFINADGQRLSTHSHNADPVPCSRKPSPPVRCSSRIKNRKVSSATEVLTSPMTHQPPGSRKSSKQRSKITKLHNVTQPSSDTKWFQSRMQIYENIVSRIAKKKLKGNYEKNTIPSSAFKLKRLEGNLIIAEKRLKKDHINDNREHEKKEKDMDSRKITALHHVLPNKDPKLSIYWYSNDAIILFNPKKDKMSCYDCLLRRIEMLETSLKRFNGWQICIEAGNMDNNMTDFEKLRVEAKI